MEVFDNDSPDSLCSLISCPNNDRWYLLQVASRHVTVHNKSSFLIPRSHFNCKQNAQQAWSHQQLCFAQVFWDRPTHPRKVVSTPVSSFVSSPLAFLSLYFFFFPFSFLLLFCLSFSFSLPLPLSSWLLRLTTTCITLHYNSSTICRAERKTTHTCCPLAPFFSLCLFSL